MREKTDLELSKTLDRASNFDDWGVVLSVRDTLFERKWPKLHPHTLTEDERIEVEHARAGVNVATNINWVKMQLINLIRTLDRLAPPPKAKTDQELADMLDEGAGVKADADLRAAMCEVRDALRARKP
jgi:hypothetical protein